MINVVDPKGGVKVLFIVLRYLECSVLQLLPAHVASCFKEVPSS